MNPQDKTVYVFVLSYLLPALQYVFNIVNILSIDCIIACTLLVIIACVNNLLYLGKIRNLTTNFASGACHILKVFFFTLDYTSNSRITSYFNGFVNYANK